MGKLDHGACRENEMLFSAVVLLQCWSIPEIYFWDLITVLTWELGFPCVFFTWDFDLLEIHLLVCDLPEASWYTWDVTYLGFIYLCLWFTWGFLIYLRLEILEVHLPVFVIYLRLLDILETWITWGSVTCVSHLPETFWFTWDLNDLRFIFTCASLLSIPIQMIFTLNWWTFLFFKKESLPGLLEWILCCACKLGSFWADRNDTHVNKITHVKITCKNTSLKHIT